MAIFETEETGVYFLANKKTVQFLRGLKPIIATKTKPTEKDYEKGHYTRYFCKRNNANNIYFEINKETYKALSSKNKKYDYNLYTADSLRWAVDGNIIETNKRILSKKEAKYPNISNLFPKLNEYQKVRKTKGGELRYLDGKEFIGYYHLHLGKPMEGLFHSSEPHKKLEYINNVSSEKYTPSGPNPTTARSPHGNTGNQEGENTTLLLEGTPTLNIPTSTTYEAPTQVQEQIPQPVSQPISTPSTGGGSSGGGGGGY